MYVWYTLHLTIKDIPNVVYRGFHIFASTHPIHISKTNENNKKIKLEKKTNKKTLYDVFNVLI